MSIINRFLKKWSAGFSNQNVQLQIDVLPIAVRYKYCRKHRVLTPKLGPFFGACSEQRPTVTDCFDWHYDPKTRVRMRPQDEAANLNFKRGPAIFFVLESL